MYEFRGMFTRQSCSSLRLDERKHTTRDLRPAFPFCAVRIRPLLDAASDDTANLEEGALELIQAGLSSGLALEYATFGGPIEHVRGFDVVDSMIVASSHFEATLASAEEDNVQALFVSKMNAYGFQLGQEGFFFPFERGFWGE